MFEFLALSLVLSLVMSFALSQWRKRRGAGAAQPARTRAPRSNPRLRGGKCRWTALGKNSAHLTQFECKTCGVIAYSSQSNGPAQCKRNLARGNAL